jgi:hypothetical protein
MNHPILTRTPAPRGSLEIPEALHESGSRRIDVSSTDEGMMVKWHTFRSEVEAGSQKARLPRTTLVGFIQSGSLAQVFLKKSERRGLLTGAQ